MLINIQEIKLPIQGTSLKNEQRVKIVKVLVNEKSNRTGLGNVIWK
jgi:hypothetical protein